MSRRKGRILAFQALFSYDVGGCSVETLMDFSWIDKDALKRNEDDSFDFARLLISGTIAHLVEIDAAIKKYLVNWDFSRLNKVDLAILRISVYSLLFQADVHPSIIIDEAIDISKEFGSDEAYKFINAVLDNVRKDCQR